MSDTSSSPDEQVTTSMSLGRIEVTACPDHPDTEPTLDTFSTAMCSACGRPLTVRWIGTVRPIPEA